MKRKIIERIVQHYGCAQSVANRLYRDVLDCAANDGCTVEEALQNMLRSRKHV